MLQGCTCYRLIGRLLHLIGRLAHLNGHLARIMDKRQVVHCLHLLV